MPKKPHAEDYISALFLYDDLGTTAGKAWILSVEDRIDCSFK